MENRAPISTTKSDFLSPVTDQPWFMGSAPPIGIRAQRSIHRYFQMRGLDLLKTYQNEKMKTVLHAKYNDNLMWSPNTADPVEDRQFTRNKYFVEVNTPSPVMPRLYPEQQGKKMEDFALIFNEQREYYKDYTTKAPRYRYFGAGGHPFTQNPTNLMDYGSTYPTKMQPAEKTFVTTRVDRQGPPLPTRYSLEGKRNWAGTAYKW